MPTYCQKDPSGLTCTKEKNSPEKSTEIKQWLNMMSSMLNFAMSSTALMKSIQNRVEVTRKIEEDARAMRAEEFHRQEWVQSMADFKGDSDFSLRSEPVREDTCGQTTCTLFPKEDVPDKCVVNCDGKKASPPKPLSKPRNKKKKAVESIGTIGGSCVCVVPLPEEPIEKDKQADEDEEDDDDDEAEANATKTESACICEPKGCDEEDENEAKNEYEGNAPGDPTCEPEVLCPALRSFDENSDDCSCPSFGYKEDDFVIEEPILPEEAVPPAEEPPQEIQSLEDCGCQTTSSEEIMVKELQMANLSYQLKQTDRNLKELKREMDRISNFVSGKKKSPNDTVAALYEEIMKPRTSLDETIPTTPRKRR